jgi:uncharacterized protein YpmB
MQHKPQKPINMKTSKQISVAVVILLMVLITSAGTFPSVKEKNKAENKAETALSESQKQCGVTTTQIITYVRNLGHTVYWTYNIPGCCNTNVGVENCTVVTVYVSGGSIVGHSSSEGVCE